MNFEFWFWCPFFLWLVTAVLAFGLTLPSFIASVCADGGYQFACVTRAQVVAGLIFYAPIAAALSYFILFAGHEQERRSASSCGNALYFCLIRRCARSTETSV